MELQQKFNLITRILKQTAGLQHIWVGRFYPLYQRQAINPVFFFRFLEIRQYCAKPAVLCTILSQTGY